MRAKICVHVASGALLANSRGTESFCNCTRLPLLQQQPAGTHTIFMRAFPFTPLHNKPIQNVSR